MSIRQWPDNVIVIVQVSNTVHSEVLLGVIKDEAKKYFADTVFKDVTFGLVEDEYAMLLSRELNDKETEVFKEMLRKQIALKHLTKE